MPRCRDFSHSPNEGLRKMRELNGVAGEPGPQRVVHVGPSERHQAMAATIWRKDDAAADFRPVTMIGDDDGEDWLSIWNVEQLGEAPYPDSAEAMERLVRAQYAYTQTLRPGGYLAGGLVLLAELTRAGLTVRPLCRLST